jgi:hypothetical protein
MTGTSIKDPKHEAKHPAAMPKDQQGQDANKSHHRDPESR